jgi:hypothetical protein
MEKNRGIDVINPKKIRKRDGLETKIWKRKCFFKEIYFRAIESQLTNASREYWSRYLKKLCEIKRNEKRIKCINSSWHL